MTLFLLHFAFSWLGVYAVPALLFAAAGAAAYLRLPRDVALALVAAALVWIANGYIYRAGADAYAEQVKADVVKEKNSEIASGKLAQADLEAEVTDLQGQLKAKADQTTVFEGQVAARGDLESKCVLPPGDADWLNLKR